MRVSVEERINVQDMLKNVKNPSFWSFAVYEWHRLITPYTPMETGTLAESVNIRGESGGGFVEYTAPYAHYQYTGISHGGKGRLNYSRERHPLASAEWDKAAEPVQKPKLVRAMQGYIDTGRLRLE